MTPIQTITEEKTIKLCGQTVEVTVTTNLYHDDLTLDDVIGDAEDRAELEARINSGYLLIGYIVVTATAFGLEGSASLGGCYIESPDDLKAYVDNYGLVDEAIKELKANIISTVDELAPFQGGESMRRAEQQDHDAIIEAMEAAKSRLETSFKYGPDMKSSADLCITDAIELLEQAIAKAKEVNT